MDSIWLTEKIKDRAVRLGFDAVGFARLAPLPSSNLDEWLARGYQGQMSYLERNREKRLDPRALYPGVVSAISVALNYYHPYQLPYEEPERGVVSRYASGDDYHRVMKDLLKKLFLYTQEISPGADGRFYVDTGPVLDKVWAGKSGLGWIGKHTNLINKKGLGSWFFLGEIFTNLELVYDQPAADHCGSCTRCIQACPTGAIVEPYLLDSRKCISYLTIELREDIPEEHRSSMRNLIFGCDICQDVCPWNRKLAASGHESFKPRPVNQELDLAEMSQMSEEDFREAYRRSPLKRTKWPGFLRNVAIAMGNSGSRRFLPHLRRLCSSEDAMVRRHAIWALEKLEK